MPGVLVASHGPFTWGKDAAEAGYHAWMLEFAAEMAAIAVMINPRIRGSSSPSWTSTSGGSTGRTPTTARRSSRTIICLLILAALGAGAAGCSLYYLMLTIQVSGQGGPSPSIAGCSHTQPRGRPWQGHKHLRDSLRGVQLRQLDHHFRPGNHRESQRSVNNGHAHRRGCGHPGEFSVLQYTLTVSVVGSGTTTPTGSVLVDYGAQTSITATTTGTFVNWTVASGTATIAAPTSATTTVTLTSGSATVQANFTP